MILRIFLLTIIVIGSFQSVSARILINEALINEPDADVSLEWIEIWNSVGRSAKLGALILVDGDTQIPLPDSSLGAESYAVLARDVNRFEERFGDSSGVWGDADIENYLLIEVDIALRNSSDSIQLIDSRDDLISYLKWSNYQVDGISLERVNPLDSDDDAVWAESIDESGSTPGRKNSVTAENFDLALSGTFEVSGALREELVAILSIENVGIGYNPVTQLRLGEDFDADSIIDQSEVFFEYKIEPIKSGDSVTIVVYETFDFGYHTIITSLEEDQKPYDNDTTVTLLFGLPPYHVVINEILPDPETPLESEWIELVNFSDTSVRFDSWSLCDATGCESIPDTTLGAHEFMILCQNSFAFTNYYGDLSTTVIEIEGWQVLNNTGDTVFIRDGTGTTIDSMFYSSVYGDNTSIERISPSTPGDETSNWFHSTSGSTPGQRNSVAGGFASSFDLSMSNKILSRNRCEYDDYVYISYNIPRDSYLTLKVFDVDGHVVREIYDKEGLTSGSIQYNGTDDSGNPLEIGMYILYGELSGAVSADKKLVFVVMDYE